MEYGGTMDFLTYLPDEAFRAAEWFQTLARDMVSGSSQMLVTAVIIIVVTGFIGGMVARRLKQPLILGYILAGVFVGVVYKASFGDPANDSINSLANIGVGLLLFSMGLEFSKSDIKPVWKVAVWGSLSQVCFTLVCGAGVAYFLNRQYGWFSSVSAMFLFGAAFVSTSTAVLVKTLSSKGRMALFRSRL